MTVREPETLSGDASRVLPEFDAPPTDPMVLLGAWLDGAARGGVREPYSAVLATADANGNPSTRVLMVKEFDGHGLIFASSRSSRKGIELADRPRASLTFYWRETLQQLTVAGPVEPLAPEHSDRLFAARPSAARAASAASQQSRPLQDEAALREQAGVMRESPDGIRRPEEWTGYRLVPESVEFWHGRPDRLHRRLRYDRTGALDWTVQRLQP